MEINEEVKAKFLDYLQTLEAGIKKAGEFSAEQAPLVVQEFLSWEFWSNATAAGLFFFVAAVVAAACCFCLRKFEWLDSVDRGVITIGSLAAFVVGCFIAVECCY